MGFSLEVVGVGKQKITRRIHIKYAENMDLKSENDGLGGKISKKIGFFKRTALKTGFGCESYALLKKGINGNQRATWQVKVGPCGDTPPNNLIFTNKFLMN
jgi:hypothetical protein